MTEIERQIIRNIQTHDIAERYRIRRAIWAQEMDLPINEFAKPYPVTQHNHYYPEPPKEPRPKTWSSGCWVTLCIFLVGLMVVAGAGVVAYWATEQKSKPLNFEVEWQDENGKWNKTVKERQEPRKEADPTK